MSKNYKILKLSVFFLFLLSLVLGFIIYKQHQEINLLEKNNVNLDNKFSDLNLEHTKLIFDFQEIDEKYILLSRDYDTLNKNYYTKIQENKIQEQEIDNITKYYNEVVIEYQELFEEVGQFKESIEESMDWFKTNATIDNLKESRKIKNLLKKCVDCQGDVCNIKLACIELINDNRDYLNLKYQLDAITIGTEDKLLTLDDFLKNKKGDCEDFALFFVAELRYLIDYVTSQNKIPIIEAIVNSDTRRKYDIVDRWYYPEGIESKLLSKEYIHPYVACGTLYDPNKQVHGGHCVVMLSKEKITTGEELKNTTTAELIEPQNALYIGMVYNDGIFKTENNDDKIYHIIGDNDYFMHSSLFSRGSESMWYSYGYYYDKILDLEK